MRLQEILFNATDDGKTIHVSTLNDLQKELVKECLLKNYKQIYFVDYVINEDGKYADTFWHGPNIVTDRTLYLYSISISIIAFRDDSHQEIMLRGIRSIE